MLCDCVHPSSGHFPSFSCSTEGHTVCGTFEVPISASESEGTGGPLTPPEGCVFDDAGEIDCEEVNLAVVACVVQAQQAGEPFVVEWSQQPTYTSSNDRRLQANADALIEFFMEWEDLQYTWSDSTVRQVPDLAACESPADATSGWQCILDAVHAAEPLALCLEAGSETVYK